jgi:hypothetical protein
LDPNNITVYTGTGYNNAGQITAYNGKSEMNVWGDPWSICNDVLWSSTGVQFPLKDVQYKRGLRVFLPGFCRSLHLEYHETVR